MEQIRAIKENKEANKNENKWKQQITAVLQLHMG